MNRPSDHEEWYVPSTPRAWPDIPPSAELLLDDTAASSQFRIMGYGPWLGLPAKSIDKWATCIRVEAATSTVPPTPYLFDELLSEETTWIIPSIQEPDRPPSFMTPVWATESYSTQLRSLVKRSGTYALSSLATPLVALVLSPFLTHNLSPNAYGALAVLNTTIALGAGVTQLGLASAFFRAYNYEYEMHKDKLAVLSTVFLLLALVSISCVLLLMLSAPWLASTLLDSATFTESVRLVALVILLQNMTVPGFAWVRVENRATFFVVLSLLNLGINLVATLVLVGVYQMGIAGSLLSVALGYSVVALCTLPLMLHKIGLKLRTDIARGLFAFGLPNVINFLSVWILQLSDRYMLAHLGSLQETALYTVAYNLGGVLGILVISPFLLVWPSALFTIARRYDATRMFRHIFRWYFIVLLFAAYALALLSSIFLTLFFPIAYHRVSAIIPLITLSILFYGIYNYLTLGVGLRQKTWLAIIFTSSAAVVNITLNLFLIPRYGSAGAALATLIAYFVLTVVAYICNQRLYPVPYEIGKFGLALAGGVALYSIGSYVVQGLSWLEGWGISLCLLTVYGSALLLLAKMRQPHTIG